MLNSVCDCFSPLHIKQTFPLPSFRIPVSWYDFTFIVSLVQSLSASQCSAFLHLPREIRTLISKFHQSFERSDPISARLPGRTEGMLGYISVNATTPVRAPMLLAVECFLCIRFLWCEFLRHFISFNLLSLRSTETRASCYSSFIRWTSVSPYFCCAHNLAPATRSSPFILQSHIGGEMDLNTLQQNQPFTLTPTLSLLEQKVIPAIFARWRVHTNRKQSFINHFYRHSLSSSALRP